MRADQIIGLNKWAENFVKGKPVLVYVEETTRVYSDGHEEIIEPEPVFEPSIQKDKSERIFIGMFGDEYPLYKYTFPDGRVFFERVQAETWSSGPVFFLALQDEEGEWVKVSLWPEEEIATA